MLRKLKERIAIKYLIWRQYICPKHLAPTFYDHEYQKRRCSVTKQALKYEIND